MKIIALIKEYAGYALLYTITLIIVTAAYLALNGTVQVPLWVDKVIAFATSPFNSAIEKQYLNNIGFTFVELLLIGIYFILKKRGRMLRLSFIAAIFASYMAALVYLKDTTEPSAGSSIVAGGLLAVAFAAVLYDLIRSGYDFWANRRSREVVVVRGFRVNKFRIYLAKVVLYLFLAMAIPLYFYGVFLEVTLVGEGSLILHIMGVIFTFIWLGIFYLYPWLTQKTQKRQG